MTKSTARQHPAELTATRLGNAVTKWADKFTAEERDMVGQIIAALDEIAEGKR